MRKNLCSLSHGETALPGARTIHVARSHSYSCCMPVDHTQTVAEVKASAVVHSTCSDLDRVLSIVKHDYVVQTPCVLGEFVVSDASDARADDAEVST